MRNRRPRHNFPSCENRIFPLAFFNVSALAAGARPAEHLPPFAVLEPGQLNTCGNGGFCRRRWDGFQPLPPIGDSRKKKRRWGNLCLLPHAHPLACGGSAPTSETFAVDGSQPLPPTGDSRKKRRWGKFVPALYIQPLFCGGDTPPRKPDPLTVISLSSRKSPGAAGALSLTPDGVSDPAAASGPRPRAAIPAGAKQAGDAKRGEGEARKAGEADSLTP